MLSSHKISQKQCQLKSRERPAHEMGRKSIYLFIIIVENLKQASFDQKNLSQILCRKSVRNFEHVRISGHQEEQKTFRTGIKPALWNPPRGVRRAEFHRARSYERLTYPMDRACDELCRTVYPRLKK